MGGWDQHTHTPTDKINSEDLLLSSGASQLALVVKNPLANAGDIRDMGSIPGSEDPLEDGMATHFGILAWTIPWTEEPGRLQSTRSQRVMAEAT